MKGANEHDKPKRVRKPKLKVMKVVKSTDKQQIAEETGHKPVAEVVEKKTRELHIVFTKKAGAYLSPELAKMLLGKLGSEEGRLAVKNIEFEAANDPNQVVAKMLLTKTP